MLTKVENTNGVTFQIDEDNNIHSCKCTVCKEFKHVDGFKNVKKGICLACGKATISDEVQALDDGMKELLEGYNKDGKAKRTIHLEDETIERIATLQERYGVTILSGLTNKVLNNALDQIEVEYEQEFKKGIK